MFRCLGVLFMLLSWLVLFSSIAGLGYLTSLGAGLARPAGKEDGRAPDRFFQFWTGFALLLFLLQVVHLAVPITAWVSYSLLGLGLGGFALSMFSTTRPAWRGLGAAWWLFLPLFGWLAVQALNGPEIPDSGIYHFQSVRWANEFRIVPGLVNLEPRLGFNQSFFLYVAFLNAPPLADLGFHLANSLLGAVLLAQMFRSVRLVAMRPRVADAAALFQTVLLPAVIWEFSPLHSFRWRSFNSPAPDCAVYILEIVLLSELIAMALPGPLARRPKLESLCLIVLLGVAGVTVKLSFLVFGLGCVLAAAFLCFRERVPFRSRPLFVSAGLSGTMLLLWMARGVVLSGYPLYPEPFLGFPVDWKAPEADVRLMTAVIEGVARDPMGGWRDASENFRWLPSWWQRVLTNTNAELYFGLAGAALLFFPFSRKFGAAAGEFRFSRMLLPLAPVAAGYLFWAKAAPDPRFLGALPACGACWLATAALLPLAPRIWARLIAPAAILFATSIGAPETRQDRLLYRDWFDWTLIPMGKTEEGVTDSGLRMRVSRGEAWNSKLPTSYGENPRLVARGKGLIHGFRLSPGPPRPLAPTSRH